MSLLRKTSSAPRFCPPLLRGGEPRSGGGVLSPLIQNHFPIRRNRKYITYLLMKSPVTAYAVPPPLARGTKDEAFLDNSISLSQGGQGHRPPLRDDSIVQIANFATDPTSFFDNMGLIYVISLPFHQLQQHERRLFLHQGISHQSILRVYFHNPKTLHLTEHTPLDKFHSITHGTSADINPQRCIPLLLYNIHIDTCCLIPLFLLCSLLLLHIFIYPYLLRASDFAAQNPHSEKILYRGIANAVRHFSIFIYFFLRSSREMPRDRTIPAAASPQTMTNTFR